MAVDRAGGAPASSQLVIQAIYQERPAQVDPTDARRVLAAIRRYETVRLEPALEAPGLQQPLFEDLRLWYRVLPGQFPSSLVINLTPNRVLHDREFEFASKQIFAPALAMTLPELPLRVGDSYELAPSAGSALLGPSTEKAELRGQLLDIRAADKEGPDQIATFEITGRGVLNLGTASVRAQLEFRFTPSVGTSPTDAQNSIVDATGTVARLVLAEEISAPASGPNGRLKQYTRRELILERRADDSSPLLEIPEPEPQPTVENSWLTYRNPAAQYELRHPQSFLRVTPPGAQPGEVGLAHPRADGGDHIIISPRSKNDLEPESIRKKLLEEWQAGQIRAVPGPSGWQPEDKWPGQKVYRIDAALEPIQAAAVKAGATKPPRVYFDGYVVLTGRNTGFYVEATTTQDPPTAFRSQVEDIIRTLTFEPATEPSPPKP